MKINRIITGHVNELFGKNKDLGAERMEICKRCPLLTHSETWGPICNPNLYLNTETMETADFHKEGFQKGCGCRLKAKTKDKESHCPTQQW